MLRTMMNNLSWPLLIAAALGLGLAPFSPEPHLVEKLRMLAGGTLHKPVDIFDLVFHASPIFLIILKLLSKR